MSKTLMYDTNAIIHLGKVVFNEPFYLSWMTLVEIEDIKNNKEKDDEVRSKAQMLSRMLRENIDKYTVIPVTDADQRIMSLLPKRKNDSIIIASAWTYRDKVVLVTDDNAMWNLASNLEEPVECVTTYNLHLLTSINEYRGYRTVHFTSPQMARFYENLSDNRYKCLENEYLVVCNRKGDVQDIRVWRDGEYKAINDNPLTTEVLGKIKARNPQQRMAFDMMRNKTSKIKVLTGIYGSGKTLIESAFAIHELHKGNYNKIIYIRNNVSVKDSKDIGYLPGSLNDKMRPYLMELADTFGGEEIIDQMLENNILEIQPLAFIRGRTYNNCIVFVSEAENLTVSQMQLIIGRIGENSVLVVNGDFRQADSAVFRNNSGITRMVEKLAGNPMFSYVRLESCERSNVSALADALD